jgi:hypothetical protein
LLACWSRFAWTLSTAASLGFFFAASCYKTIAVFKGKIKIFWESNNSREGKA